MNTRTQRLAEMANAAFDSAVPYGFADQFVTLVVKQCRDVIYNADISNVEGGDYEVLAAVVSQIFNHFGIDE